MKKILFLMFVGASFFKLTPSIGQHVVADKEDAEKVKNNPLIVVLMGEDEKVVSKLTKNPENLKNYREGIEKYNAYLKDAVEREWKFSQEVVFILPGELEKVKAERNDRFCQLESAEVRNYKMGDFYSSSSNSGFNSSSDLAYHLSTTANTNGLAIKWAGSPKNDIVQTYFPAMGLSKGSMTLMIQNLQNQLEDALINDITKISDWKKDAEKRTPELKDKTLLILEETMSNGLTKAIEKGDLGKYYGPKYEVVNFDQLEKYIIEKDDRYAYTWIIPAGAQSQGKTLYNYFIVDAKDGRFMYMTGMAVAGANGQFHHGQLMQVNKKLK